MHWDNDGSWDSGMWDHAPTCQCSITQTFWSNRVNDFGTCSMIQLVVSIKYWNDTQALDECLRDGVV